MDACPVESCSWWITAVCSGLPFIVSIFSGKVLLGIGLQQYGETQGKLSYTDTKTFPLVRPIPSLAVGLKCSSCCFIPVDGQGLLRCRVYNRIHVKIYWEIVHISMYIHIYFLFFFFSGLSAWNSSVYWVYQFTETEEACKEFKANKPEKQLLEEGSGRDFCRPCWFCLHWDAMVGGLSILWQ